jgi:hypothetical protein
MLLHNVGHRAEVVEVCVGEPDSAQTPSAAGYAAQNLRRIPSRVNNYTVTASVIRDDEAIRDHRPEGHFLNLHHILYWTRAHILQCVGMRDYNSAARGMP